MEENYSYYYCINWKVKRYSKKANAHKTFLRQIWSRLTNWVVQKSLSFGKWADVTFVRQTEQWYSDSQTDVFKDEICAKGNFLAAQEKSEQTEFTNENTQKVHFTTGIGNRNFNSPTNHHTSLQELDQTNQVRRHKKRFEELLDEAYHKRFYRLRANRSERSAN